MGVDYCMVAIGWEAHVNGPLDGESVPDFEDRMESYMLDDGVEFLYHHPHGYGLGSFEIYETIKSKLVTYQRKLLDQFFGSLMTDYFIDGMEHPVEATWVGQSELTLAALKPETVSALADVFSEIDIPELTAIVNEDWALTKNCQFESTDEFIKYVRALGELVRFATNSNAGLLVTVG